MTSLVQWIAKRDRNFVALRRAARGALVTPALFALAYVVMGKPVVATYAAYGAVGLLLLVDFSGSMRQRLVAQGWLVVMGAALICLGTLVSGNAWLAAATMTLVAFVVLFSGVVSSVLARASTSLLLAFILAVSTPGLALSIPERLEGWLLAGVVSLAAIALLWPSPAVDPLRRSASAACRALASRLRSEIAYDLHRRDAEFVIDHDREIANAKSAVSSLYALFLASPYRPTALGTSARTIVRLVDELSWLSSIVEASAANNGAAESDAVTSAVKVAAASVLESGADLLDRMGGDTSQLRVATSELDATVARLESAATAAVGARARSGERMVDDVVARLEPAFRAQELGFSVSLIADNIVLTAAAERRGWLDRILGRQPGGISSAFAVAERRVASHVERHSVWLRNSVRGAVALGLAVLVADMTGVERSFWVIFAALSVLRSSALHTGQNVARALTGTVLGFIASAVLLALIGTNATVLWILLPISVFLAGVAPAAISFTAGQAAFTLTVVILYNIVQPAGWRAGLIRVEDIALGCAVSLVVGALFWPRGARAALRDALAEAYADVAAYLSAAVDFATRTCSANASMLALKHPSPKDAALRANAAVRRLDDTFRNYLAERGAKPYPLAELTPLITGVGAMRLAADAIVDLWRREAKGSARGTTTACRELVHAARETEEWYDELGESIVAQRQLPEPQESGAEGERRLVDALRSDLRGRDEAAAEVAVRLLWTSDHIDRVRRLQRVILEPLRAESGLAAGKPGTSAARA